MGSVASQDAAMAAVETAFKDFEEEKADIYEMGKIAKVGEDAVGEGLQAVADGSGVCSFPGLWLSAVLEGAHVLLGGRREDRICLHSLFPGDLEEVRQTSVRPSGAALTLTSDPA